jgi:hypothetical protein
MPKIEIDDEVFAYLQAHARPFVDTPNTTLRRLLDVGSVPPGKERKVGDPELDALLAESMELAAKRSKAPKADLHELVQRGIVRNGQKLYLIDYKGNRVKKLSALVSGSSLSFEGKRYSMSSLAAELLQREGFTSQAVRGPAHWVTEDGKTIKQLWDESETVR